MKLLSFKHALFVICLALINTSIHAAEPKECSALLNHEHSPLRKEGTVKLCDLYQDKVLLVVNTASKCGYTPQLKGLEALYQKYKDRGLVVMGFPSNDFRQELDQDQEIDTFCEINYGVTFPMFSRSSVKGSDANGLFKALAQTTGKQPQWNFNKYLIDRTGQQARHFPSNISPSNRTLVEAIEALL
ncbi:MAG: glutathione peroxidase [Pseudomonadales bacterium]|nr:glutathione peroxidase [Pseudomonadales bacterium]